MKRSRVAKRYALALFELAVENKQLEIVESDLNRLQKDYDKAEEFRQLMDSPVVPKESKQKVFTQIYKHELQAATFNFVSFLIEKNREALIADVVADFHYLLDEHRGIVRGEVFSVVRLSDTQLTNLKERLDKMTGKNVIVTQHIDKSLLGGFVVRINDKVYDTSLRNQLGILRQSLAE